MRGFLFFLFVVIVFSTPAKADWTDRLIQYNCDPQTRVFNISTVGINSNLMEDDLAKIMAKGKLISQTGGVKYKKVETSDWRQEAVIPDLTQLPQTVMTCEISAANEPGRADNSSHSFVFRLDRTGIDGGRVQGMCGAAIGASFTLYLNDEKIAYFRSDKERCMNYGDDNLRINYADEKIEKCWQSGAEVCISGKIEDFLNYLKRENKKIEKANETQIAYSTLLLKNSEEILQPYLERYYERFSEQEERLKNMNADNESIQARISSLSETKSELEDQVSNLKEELDKVYTELDTERSKSIWQRWFGQKD